MEKAIRLAEITKFRELNPIEEDQLEKNITWIICHGRSGSTWLAEGLLNHPDNVIWNEPWIGFHLQVSQFRDDPKSGERGYERVFDQQSKNDKYFFSEAHEITWKPALRKLLLARAFSQSKSLEKNIIIKEPTAAGSADILLSSLPNCKMIFLVRDERDILDSRIAMHGEKTWAKLAPLNEKKRSSMLLRYCYQLIHEAKYMWKAYLNFNPNRRLFVKYEDLRLNTVPELKKIYNFIGVKIEDGELEKIVNLHSFENIPDHEKGEEKFNRSAKIGGYKKKFDTNEQKVMNEIMGDTLRQFGYEV